jgi:outer membrane autotransporter protein
MYVTHELDNKIKFTSMFFAGMDDASLDRTLAFGDLHEDLNDNLDNYYVGLNNTISRRFDMNKFYIDPKFKLNVTHLMVDDISESGDFGADVNMDDATSVETGVELALGKDILLANNSKINLEAAVGGYAQVGDAYKDFYSTFDVLSDKSVKVDNQEGNNFYGEFTLRATYLTPQLLGIYGEIEHTEGDVDSDTRGSLGFNFMF